MTANSMALPRLESVLAMVAVRDVWLVPRELPHYVTGRMFRLPYRGQIDLAMFGDHGQCHLPCGVFEGYVPPNVSWRGMFEVLRDKFRPTNLDLAVFAPNPIGGFRQVPAETEEHALDFRRMVEPAHALVRRVVLEERKILQLTFMPARADLWRYKDRDRLWKVLDRPLEALELPPRVLRLLRERLVVERIGHLVAWPASSIVHMEGLGTVGVQAIDTAMEEAGVDFGMDTLGWDGNRKP